MLVFRNIFFVCKDRPKCPRDIATSQTRRDEFGSLPMRLGGEPNKNVFRVGLF